MKRLYVLLVGVVLLGGVGCEGPRLPEPPTTPPVSAGNKKLSDLARKYETSGLKAATPPAPPHRPNPLSITGTWVPSGWMGDAISGAVRHRLCTEDTRRPVPEEWTYDPARGTLGWAAVAYQFPDSNFGSEKGKNLRGTGYTTLRVVARGQRGGERVLFKSGGHTQPGAPHPASYESTSGVVTLGKDWTSYDIPVGPDLSNVPAAFTFVVTQQLCPEGCTFYLADVSFVKAEP